MKDVKTVLFLGDSVTDCGRDRSDLHGLGDGYPLYVAEGWRKALPDSKTEFINRGISGARSGLLLERYEEDCKQYSPDVISVLIGINDTWRCFDSSDPTSTSKFEDNYRALLCNIRRDFPKAKLIMLEQFLLHTDPAKKRWHWDLDPKIQVTRALGAEYADLYIALDGYLNGLAMSGVGEAVLTADGVHPTQNGHRVIAAKWLRTLGIEPGDTLLTPELTAYRNLL